MKEKSWLGGYCSALGGGACHGECASECGENGEMHVKSKASRIF